LCPETLPAGINHRVNECINNLNDRFRYEKNEAIIPINTPGSCGVFEAKLAYDKYTQTIYLAFNGTGFERCRIGSMVTDVQQYLGMMDDVYERAILLADLARQCFGAESLRITGHSLGGGMVQLATTCIYKNLCGTHGTYSCLRVHLLNSVPINKTILLRAKLTTAQLMKANENIIKISVKGEALSDVAFSNSHRSRNAQLGKNHNRL
jgi:hypothetical protein